MDKKAGLNTLLLYLPTSCVSVHIIMHNFRTPMEAFLCKNVFCFLNYEFRLPPLEGVLALWSEVVHVRFEVEFEDVILVDVLGL